MKLDLKRLAASAIGALAGSILISFDPRWMVKARRRFRAWRAATS